MNQEQPLGKDLEGILQHVIEEREQKKRREVQRLEMLREGRKVAYGGMVFEYHGEEQETETIVELRNPDTNSILKAPMSMLAENGWELVPESSESEQ